MQYMFLYYRTCLGPSLHCQSIMFGLDGHQKTPIMTVKKFCETHNAWKRVLNQHGERIFTHLDLSGEQGGVINIPDALNDAFLLSYATDFIRDESHECFLVEARTPVFRFFCDVDFKGPEDKCPSEIDFLLIFREIIWDIARFYPAVTDMNEKRDLFRCVVLSCPDKLINQNGGDLYEKKIGFHLHFPNLLVNQDQALLIHASSVSTLDRKGRVILSGESWENVLDPCVYKANGLRMVMSDKLSTCKVCKNKKDVRSNCDECHCVGKISEGRRYEPVFTFDGIGVEDRAFHNTLSDMLVMVKTVSIRAPSEVADSRFKRYDGSPSPYPIAIKRACNLNKQVACRARCLPCDTIFPKDIGLKRQRKTISDASVYEVISRVIKTYLPPVYHNLEIRDATYLDNTQTAMWIRVNGEGSNYCQNKKGDHLSSRVWFHINKHGITQRCFSSKNRETMQCCATYTSPFIPLTQRDINGLFPPVTKADKRKRSITNEHSLQNEDDDENEEIELSKMIQTLSAIVFGSDINATNCVFSKSSNNSRKKKIMKSFDTLL